VTSFALPLSTRGVGLLDSADGVTSFPLPLSGAEVGAGAGEGVGMGVRIPTEELEPFFNFGGELLASTQ
jgi:hypothetical protein